MTTYMRCLSVKHDVSSSCTFSLRVLSLPCVGSRCAVDILEATTVSSWRVEEREKVGRLRKRSAVKGRGSHALGMVYPVACAYGEICGA